MDLNDRQHRVTLALQDDAIKLIASLKIQRWDAFKWTVTTNLALAAASVAFHDLPYASWLFTGFSIAVAILGKVLIAHHNLRMTKVRQRLRGLNELLGVYELPKVENLTKAEKGPSYDKQELFIFKIGTFGSVLPCVVVAVFYLIIPLLRAG